MRFVAAVVVLIVGLPALSVSAADLDELLQRSQDASYSAEQAISCSTPDGVRDAIVRIAQSGEEIRVGAAIGDDVEVSAGGGGWTLSSQGGVITSTFVATDRRVGDSGYDVEEVGESSVLGRPVTSYRLNRDGVTRAELVFDDLTGVLVSSTTFNEDGSAYCLRRFVSFDDADPHLVSRQAGDTQPVEISHAPDANLPEKVAGFSRLDLYEDEPGFRFAYYSDGFFSFAVFETPSTVRLPDGVTVELGDNPYQRLFTPGQASYVWETPDGGMALVGDLPPDLHEQVLATLPTPDTPSIFRRLWRTLFG